MSILRSKFLLLGTLGFGLCAEAASDDGVGHGAAGGASGTSGASGSQDLQAQIDKAVNAAISKKNTEFSEALEKATGHKDLTSLQEAQLKEQGRLSELADANKAEASTWKGKYESTLASAEIMAAAGGVAVDPALVSELLSGKAKVDGNGNVSIDGKTASEAVKDLLLAKPFLARAQGGTGSGSPQNGANSQTKTRSDFDSLSPGERQKFLSAGGKVVD